MNASCAKPSVPPRSWIHRIEDILDAIARIQTHTAGLDFERFKRDAKTADAVNYLLLVIGEAAAHLPPDVSRNYPEIPWAEIRDMRNVMAHGYFVISQEIVWQTIANDLPPLVEKLRRVLDATDKG